MRGTYAQLPTATAQPELPATTVETTDSPPRALRQGIPTVHTEVMTAASVPVAQPCESSQFPSNFKFDPITGAPINRADLPTACSGSSSPHYAAHEGTFAQLPVATVAELPAATPVPGPLQARMARNILEMESGQAAQRRAVIDPYGLFSSPQGADAAAPVPQYDEFGNELVYEDSTCAQLGCLFSCIPLVGWVTAYINMQAPEGSRRRAFGRMAFFIATYSFFHISLRQRASGGGGGGWGQHGSSGNGTMGGQYGGFYGGYGH